MAQFVKNSKGNDFLKWQGHLFVKDKGKNEKIYWKCKHFRTLNCRKPEFRPLSLDIDVIILMIFSTELLIIIDFEMISDKNLLTIVQNRFPCISPGFSIEGSSKISGRF